MIRARIGFIYIAFEFSLFYRSILGTIKDKVKSEISSSIVNQNQNPLQILTAKTQENWSGCLEIEELKDISIRWQVYFDRGRIQYVGSNRGQKARLNYLWQKFNLDTDFLQFPTNRISEYEYLCQGLTKQKLSRIAIEQFLFKFTKEGLTHVLSINQTRLRARERIKMPPALVAFDLQQLIANERINAWRKTKRYCNSPFSRLYVERNKSLKFYQIWKDLYAYPGLYSLAKSQHLSAFCSLFISKNTLYEIAYETQVDIFLLAKYLELAFSEKAIYLLPFKNLKQLPKSSKVSNKPTAAKPKAKNKISIVCIDDSKTVQKQVQKSLEAVGYQVTAILDPKQALKRLAKQQPKIIFLDINMPHINGYDLCATLRKSQKFKDIPIVMLTGRDGVIDRVRAKLVGATDYLTKPCHPYKLIQIAENLLEKQDITH